MPITIDDVHAVYRSSTRVTEKQLDAAENQLGAELPRGYRAFLTQFGHGWINDWLQFYCPDTNLLEWQREEMLQQFDDDSQGAIACDGGKLTRSDIVSSIQIGIVTDVRYLFACRRFPGSLFDWSGRTITQHETGLEVLDPFAALGMDKFAYFIPLQPVSENGYVVCRSKRLTVPDVVQAFEDQCGESVHAIDVSREIPAYWIFPEKLGVKFHVFAGKDNRYGNTYVKYRTAPKVLAKVESIINLAGEQLGVKFKPASTNKRAV